MKLLLAALAAFLLCAGTTSAAPIKIGPPAVPSGSLSLTYSLGQCGNNACWTCKGPVALDSVYINVDTNAVHEDAVKLAAGCTGSIGSLVVVTQSADGVKVTEGAHDLLIGSGSVVCLDKAPDLHQDAVQAMGGSSVLFKGLTLDCGRADVSLIDSNFFVKMAGSSTEPPSDIVCDGCHLGPYAAHTVNIQASIRSGVSNSTVCPGKYPRLTFTIGLEAVEPVNVGNSLPLSCSSGGLAPAPSMVCGAACGDGGGLPPCDAAHYRWHVYLPPWETCLKDALGRYVWVQGYW